MERGLLRPCRCWAGWPAAATTRTQSTQVYLNGEVFEEGGVAISVAGPIELVGVISQGCTPIGETWTLTHVEGNLIHKIANRAAYGGFGGDIQQACQRPGPAEIAREFVRKDW